MNSGPTDVTRGVVRLFRGLGIAMCWTSFVNAVYHNIVLTYTLFYLYSVSRSRLVNLVMKRDSFCNVLTLIAIAILVLLLLLLLIAIALLHYCWH